MAEPIVREKRDLVLSENEYAYMQDITKGSVKTYTGPCVVTPSGQEVPIQYDPVTHSFVQVESIDSAKRKSLVVPEGFYCVLTNPAKNGLSPEKGKSSNAAELAIGKKIIIAGNTDFALWPGQEADLIRGHHLRSNQYLVVKVYNEEEARKNWASAIVKPAAIQIDTEGKTPEQIETLKKEAAEKAKQQASTQPKDLTMGKQLIIKGTEVSFYIPPTGVTVTSEKVDGKQTFVREALTLERLEYSILIDEDGNKRYANGPTVVFPKPTERFMLGRNDEGQETKKFRAIELNPLQGIHLKVIADYEENGKKFKAGEELFITGNETAIYYPREEHSAIKYDGRTKHFASAVPEGEARYVMQRMTGVIDTVKGPNMLLPDPRTEIIVRRVLSDKQVTMWYPGNIEALQYNQSLRRIMSQVPTTRGAPSEGDVERGAKGLKGQTAAQNFMLAASASNAVIADSSRVSKEQGYVGEEFLRASTFTSPRTLTLDTKYQGVPQVEIWTGYCVQVESKNGDRHVVKGPATVLLGYNETLAILEMSTGKPKNTDNLLKTVFLRTDNNQISDIIRAETSDHVQVEMKLSYWVNFEGDPNKWFSVENYVKYLCDHVRSIVKGKVKKLTIAEFYANSTDLLRGIILNNGGAPVGESWTGMLFEANGMRVTDVEVLGVTIADDNIRRLLDGSQTEVVRSNIELDTLRRNLNVIKQKEEVAREEVQTKAETIKQRNTVESDIQASNLALVLLKLGNRLKELSEQEEVLQAEEATRDYQHDANLARTKRAQEQSLALDRTQKDQEILFLKGEAEAIVAKFQAVGSNFSTALLSLSNNETLVKVAEAWNIQRAIGGETLVDALSKAFPNGPLSGLVKQLTAAIPIIPNGTSDKPAPAAKS
jgi:major vault protein